MTALSPTGELGPRAQQGGRIEGVRPRDRPALEPSLRGHLGLPCSCGYISFVPLAMYLWTPHFSLLSSQQRPCGQCPPTGQLSGGHGHCCREPLPGIWDQYLDQFQKLLVLRCLRGDKVTNAMQDFVATNLEPRFIEPQVSAVSQRLG